MDSIPQTSAQLQVAITMVITDILYIDNTPLGNQSANLQRNSIHPEAEEVRLSFLRKSAGDAGEGRIMN